MKKPLLLPASNQNEWHNSGWQLPMSRTPIGVSTYWIPYDPLAYNRMCHEISNAAIYNQWQPGESIKMLFASKYTIYVIHRLGGPYLEKLCPRSWVWPRVVLRPRAQFFPIWTDLGRWRTLLIFFWGVEKIKENYNICCSHGTGHFNTDTAINSE